MSLSATASLAASPLPASGPPRADLTAVSVPPRLFASGRRPLREASAGENAMSLGLTNDWVAPSNEAAFVLEIRAEG